MSSQKKFNTSSKQSLSVDVRGQLSEFYKVAKEKLLAIKKDIAISKKRIWSSKREERKERIRISKIIRRI